MIFRVGRNAKDDRHLSSMQPLYARILSRPTAGIESLEWSRQCATLAKKLETGTQAKHRRVHAQEITRLRHVRAVVSIFLVRVVNSEGKVSKKEGFSP